ncbi:hypothetical protein BH10PSE17_BH10PSE17_10040 [soil metagenome]
MHATGRILQQLARVVALSVVLIAITVLIGYARHDSTLITVFAGLQGMSPLTATGLLLVACAALADSWNRRSIARTCAVVVAGVTFAVLCTHVLTGGDSVSPVVTADLFGLSPALGGRMSIATAVCLASLAAATWLHDHDGWSDALATIALVISGAALLGYAYGVQDLYAVRVFNSMALNTSVGLFGLSLASILVQPDRGWAAVIGSDQPGGSASRRQLAFGVLPPLAGWLLLQATDARQLGPAAAMAFLVILTVLPLALLILRDGRVLNTLEAERTARSRLQTEHGRVLEQRLAEQADQLEQVRIDQARNEASRHHAQRMEAVGQLTGGIAHDFNNLLMGIGGNLQLLLRKLDAYHAARRHAESARAAAEKGSKLTAQLLAFSRTQKLDVRAIEIDPVLVKALDLIGTALGSRIDVQLALNAPDRWASTDPDQLELAVRNLALNARDAMAGGGRLTLSSRIQRTQLADHDSAEDFVVVTVADDGHGMTPDVLAQSIEPFFTTKERGKGTGLGLAQVYGFARQCRGDLRIQSEPGRGTSVELWLPMTAPAPAPAALEHDGSLASNGSTTSTGIRHATSPVTGSRRLLLVIDDDDSVRGVLVDALQAAGFDVVEASNGTEGLEQLARHRPEAAIIDFIMPGLNGAEVARRAQHQVPGLPIIFVSGYYDTLALDGIVGAQVLRKPFDIDGLHRAVASILD